MLFKLIVIALTLFLSGTVSLQAEEVKGQENTPSLAYVEAMGNGWNLGNTFDSFDEHGDRGEESWGNPKVTKELIRAVKDKGFQTIRMPFTSHMRIGGPEEEYTIDSEFLDRYEEVVNWALEEDLYVMVNVHHDSWAWLTHWNGEEEAEEFIKYTRIWEQLLERFKDYGDKVLFESINEPEFPVSEEEQIQYVTLLNETFYHMARESGGNNAGRMLVFPSVYTDHSQNRLDALYEQITVWEDPHIIATVHYYGDWVYSTNIGKTRFDEPLWGNVTPRTSAIEVFDRVAETFVDNGIGVIIGEYGLLGYDKSETINQFGETYKYLEFVNYYAREKGMNLILWDNGQHINRQTYDWHHPPFGEIIEASLHGRSSYAEGLDTLYLSEGIPSEGLFIPLVLNGNALGAVLHKEAYLTEGVDYTYESETIHLSVDYLTALYEESNQTAGTVISFTFQFTDGADWQQKLVFTEPPVMSRAEGKVDEAFKIPTIFNGNHLERVTSLNESGKVVSNNDWWDYLENGNEFIAHYEEGFVEMSPAYMSLLREGTIDLVFTYYNGDVIEYALTIEEGKIEGSAPFLEDPIGEDHPEDEETSVETKESDTDEEEKIEEVKEESSRLTYVWLAVIGVLVVGFISWLYLRRQKNEH